MKIWKVEVDFVQAYSNEQEKKWTRGDGVEYSVRAETIEQAMSKTIRRANKEHRGTLRGGELEGVKYWPVKIRVIAAKLVEEVDIA